jgi:hypothetical protein
MRRTRDRGGPDEERCGDGEDGQDAASGRRQCFIGDSRSAGAVNVDDPRDAQ